LIYDGQDVLIEEGNGYDCEEEAEDKASDMVARYLYENHFEYCYCVIQKRVVPVRYA
jgi:hypothetical protein